MNDEMIPEFLSHDQITCGVQRFYDILWEHHDLYQQEEQHAQKDAIAALQEAYSDIFEAILCYNR